MEGATPRRGGELVRTCGRTSYSPPVPHQWPKNGGSLPPFPPASYRATPHQAGGQTPQAGGLTPER